MITTLERTEGHYEAHETPYGKIYVPGGWATKPSALGATPKSVKTPEPLTEGL